MRRLKLLAALAAACLAAWQWLAPTYIEIDVPVPKTGLVEFWQEQHRSRLSDRGLTGVVYVYRQFGTTSEKHAWKSEAEVFAFFEEHLARLGWKFSVAGAQDRIAPESHLLGPDSHRLYYLPGNRHARLTLSIWRYDPAQNYFKIAMTSANDSLGRRLGEIIDD
jgi:hypothetical protein